MDYGSLIYLALQRARNAREAIEVMTSLVAQFGYASTGESFTIGDVDELWIMEMVGKAQTRGAGEDRSLNSLRSRARASLTPT